ncbi:MAG: hypothetical protein ACRC6X_05385 [Culicoidibacterales bacterium]
MPSTCILLAVAPIYEQTIWFEQVLDYLSEKPNATILLPKITLFDQTIVETNLIYGLLEKQFEQIMYYEVDLPAKSAIYSPTEQEVLAQATEKLCQYIQFDEKLVQLKDMNQPVNYLLAKQYDIFLTENCKRDFLGLQDKLATALVTTIEQIATAEIIIICDIEHAFNFKAKLWQNEQNSYYIFGEKMEEDENEEV